MEGPTGYHRSGGLSLTPLPVLFTHFGDAWIRGSETLLLDLLRRLDPTRVRPIVWCNGTEMAQACKDAGHITHRTDFAFYLDAGSPAFNARHYAALLREGASLVRQHDIRVLHANSAAPSQWLLPTARRLRLPLLVHLHTAYLRRSRYTLLLHLADSIVGVSRQVLEALLADGVPSSRMRVIHNGIDFDRLTGAPASDLRQTLGIPHDALVIGAPGSLIARKGLDILIPAFSALPPQAHLLIAGTGPEQPALMQQTASLGLTDRVHFIGFCDPIATLYRACDVVALASRTEAFGLVLAEAGFCSRPVIATRVGGVPEVVADGETGLLVAPDDAAALAQALQTMAGDPALRRRLGQAGHARAQTLFSADRMVQDFHTEYDRLAAVPRADFGWRAAVSRLPIYKGLIR